MYRTSAGLIGVILVLLFAGPANSQSENESNNSVSAGGILDDRMDTILRQWWQHTAEVKSLYAEFRRTSVDVVWRKKSSSDGSARYLQPNRARLDIDGEESYVLTDKGEVWEYNVPLRQIVVYKLPPEMAKNAVQDGQLPFLFATTPEKAKARYKLQIIHEDENIVHLQVEPRLEKDKVNFVRALLWIKKNERFLPAKLWFLEPNKNEVTYEFKKIWVNIDIEASDFIPKRIKDWNFVEKQVADRADNKQLRLQR